MGLFGGTSGPSAAEQAIMGGQASLFEALSSQAKDLFGESSDAYRTLMGTYAPIAKAGPYQFGFGSAEEANMRSQAVNQAAVAARSSRQAAADRISTMGGLMPSGAKEALMGRIDQSAAEQLAATQQGITQKGYDVGRGLWAEAARGVMEAPGVYRTAIGAGEAAAGAGSKAFESASKIHQEQVASEGGGIGGLLGGLAGMAVNAFAPGVGTALSSVLGGLGKKGGGGGPMDATTGQAYSEAYSEVPYGSR